MHRATMPTQSTNRALVRFYALLLVAGLMAGCGAGSGSDTVQNPITTPLTVSNYNGPPPLTADVQRFKLNVWDNLVPNNRCGSCHNESQSPRFVRADDINTAYDIANTLVELEDPGASLLVTKVRGGHNCWLTDDNACGDIIQSYIENWADEALGGSGKEVELVAPPIKEPGASKNYPSSPGAFQTTVYPLLTTYCSECHSEDAAVPQSPFFASSDVDAAYLAAQPRMNLDTPSDSRFVLRLSSEFHNCWDDCTQNGNEMLARITEFADGIDLQEIDPALVTSKALNLTDGVISSSGGRHENNVVALYEFKTGTGSTAFDTSGVEPALNLSLSGSYNWVGGWGVQFLDGKAQGTTTSSAKLHQLINATNEYSVEAWVVPANVTQDGPARIVAYSGGTDAHNFMLGQTLYTYEAANRSTESDGAGAPNLVTSDQDEDLQASLQHVVLTYDPANGRQIFVNGEHTDDIDGETPGLLNTWDDTFAFALGSEVDNTNRWAGTIRLVAIHNRALTPDQVRQNFDVGVGEKYFLLFNVSEHVGIDDAYVVAEVSQMDSYGYLFDAPFFVILDPDTMPGVITVNGMRIGMNGRELRVGQAYQNLDMNISDAAYAAEGQQPLSRLGTVIPQEKGPAQDEFFLTFEQIGDATNVVTEPAVPAPPPPAPVPRDPVMGLRNFAEVNATMSALTGIPTDQPDVLATYDLVYQAMPVDTSLAAFASSAQMGITQLAIKYCSVLIDDPARRSSYFPGFDFSASAASAFSDRTLVTDPLLDRMIGTGIQTQPVAADVESQVNDLIDRLIACGGSCESDRTVKVVKGACASVLASAAMLIQ